MRDDDLLVIDQARKNLIDFCIATNPNYKSAWHLEVIAKELENIEQFGDRDYKVLIIEVPPRHGKSELSTVNFPAWFLGRNPTKEIITISYNAELAQDFGGKTRGIIDGEYYRHIFNVSLKEDEQAKAKWKTNKGGSYTSVGVGGAITGRGANILIFDDPIKSREEAESEVYRAKVSEFFISTAFTRLEPKAVIVVILQRWHTDDLVGRILQNPELKNRCKIIHFPAIAEVKEQYRNIGEALWPERFNVEQLKMIKNTLGPYNWSAQYQGSPIISENQEFKPEWIKHEQDYLIENGRRFLTVDTAMSKNAYADYTGFCDNSVDRDNFWHLRAWKMRVGPEELVDMLFSLHYQNHYEAIGIEKTTYTDGLKPYLDNEQRRRNKFLPLVELSHSQRAKEIRIRGLIPRYASGSIKHVDGRCKDLEEEMFGFPFGTHDDVLDATAYQLQIADQPHQVHNQEVSVFIPDYAV